MCTISYFVQWLCFISKVVGIKWKSSNESSQMWYIEKSVSMSLNIFFLPFLGTSYLAGMCLQSQQRARTLNLHKSSQLEFEMIFPGNTISVLSKCHRMFSQTVKKQRRQRPAEQREWHGAEWPRGSVAGRWPGRMAGAPALSATYSRARDMRVIHFIKWHPTRWT